MSQEITTLLPSVQYMTAPDADLHLTVDLKSTSKYIVDNSISTFLDMAEQFDSERQSSEKYRVMGNFNYLSLIRDLKETYTITSLSELFENNNYRGKEYNFDYYFDIQVVYPHKFIFKQVIDSNQSLYLSEYTVLTSVTYQQIRSAYQENSYNELMWNIISNQYIDLSDAKIHIDDLNIFLPLNELSLYITLKDKSRVLSKILVDTYSINNLFLHSGTTLGYDDTQFNLESYTNGDFDQAIINLNDKPNTGYYDVEFVNKYRNSILLLFKLNNIEIQAQNIRLNTKYIKNYLSLLRDTSDVTYSSILSNPVINGGYVIFDKSDFTWEKTESVDHRFHIDYDYSNDFFIQLAKEGIGFLEDYAYVYYPEISGTQTKALITYQRFYIENNSLNIVCKVSDLSYLNNFVSNYDNLLNTIPNPLRFNNVTYVTIDSNSIILIVNKKSKIEVPNSTDSNLKIYFKYNPFIHIKYKEYTTSLQITDDVKNISIPDYAIFNNNLYKWRNPLDKGFIEPDTGVGFDYPFLNDNTYIDNNFRFYVCVDNSDIISNKIFSDFNSNIVIDNFNRNKVQGDC